jgi:hypothetical protein
LDNPRLERHHGVQRFSGSVFIAWFLACSARRAVQIQSLASRPEIDPEIHRETPWVIV